MATIRKRNVTYQIRVSCGYDTKGNQVVQTMSWKPDEGMTPRQIEKEVQRQAMLFEDRCLKGRVTANIKFADFADQWFEEYARLNLRHTSYTRIKQLTRRVYPAIGHLRMDKITSGHIRQFINDLALNGKNKKTGMPLSRKTVIHHLDFISGVFGYAVKLNMLNDNPCKNVTVLSYVSTGARQSGGSDRVSIGFHKKKRPNDGQTKDKMNFFSKRTSRERLAYPFHETLGLVEGIRRTFVCKSAKPSGSPFPYACRKKQIPVRGTDFFSDEGIRRRASAPNPLGSHLPMLSAKKKSPRQAGARISFWRSIGDLNL